MRSRGFELLCVATLSLQPSARSADHRQVDCTCGCVMCAHLQKGEKYDAHMDAFYDQRESIGAA